MSFCKDNLKFVSLYLGMFTELAALQQKQDVVANVKDAIGKIVENV